MISELHARLLADQDIPPPPGLAGSLIRALRAALPPHELAESFASLPVRERERIAALFAERPVVRTVRIKRTRK
jgi:hypothetical protein